MPKNKKQRAGSEESELKPEESVSESKQEPENPESESEPEKTASLGSSEQDKEYAKQDDEIVAMGEADKESVLAEQYEADEEAWEQVRKIEEALKNLKASLKKPSMGGKSKKQKNRKNKNKKTRKQRRR